MSIKIKFRFGTNGYADKRAISLALIILFIPLVVIYLENLFQGSRESNSPSCIHNGTLSSVFFKCSIPYDKYRCSVLSNRSNNSIKCITDVQAMTGHILPLVSYVLQLYLIQEYFSFADIYNYNFTDVFWITVLVIFAIIAIAVHGSSCLHFYTCMIICSTGVCLSGFVFYELVHCNRKYFSRKIRDVSQSQRLVTDKQDCETTITIVVS
jgi:hypothetical protein